MPDVDPLKAFALFAPEDLDQEAPKNLGQDQGIVQGAPRAGERLGERYALVDSLGRGGMGLVFRARDEVLEREVALKVLLLESEKARKRFAREAEVTAGLQARHVVKVFGSGFVRGYPYIVYELIEGGRTLLEAFEEAALERRLDLLEEVAAGLASAHAAGVVHRDLKPENVLVRPTGEAVVLDFGLAGVARSSLTQTGEVMGTPAYMAPEQLRGEEATPACDVWALGLLLYEALYLEHPFLVGQVGLPGLMGRIVEARFECPSDAPPALRALVRRIVVPKPEARPPDAGAFLDELRAARRAPTQAASGSYLAAGALVVALVGAGLWFATREGATAPTPSASAVARASATPGASPSTPALTPGPTLAPSPAPSSTGTRAATPTPTPAEDSAEAIFQRGWALVIGDEPKDYEGGLALMAEAARRGHPEALYQIGRHQLLNGAAGGQARAENLFRRAASLGHAGAMWRLAMLADDDPETGTKGEALEWYRRAADSGHLNAMYTYGLTLIEGVHGEKDPQKGMAYLEEASARGYAQAKCQLALRIVTGDHGSKADPPRAIRLMEEAVIGDVSLAKYVLGRWLMNGQWVLKDVKRGQELIREAAAQGDPDALEFLKRAAGPQPSGE